MANRIPGQDEIEPGAGQPCRPDPTSQERRFGVTGAVFEVTLPPDADPAEDPHVRISIAKATTSFFGGEDQIRSERGPCTTPAPTGAEEEDRFIQNRPCAVSNARVLGVQAVDPENGRSLLVEAAKSQASAFCYNNGRIGGPEAPFLRGESSVGRAVLVTGEDAEPIILDPARGHVHVPIGPFTIHLNERDRFLVDGKKVIRQRAVWIEGPPSDDPEHPDPEDAQSIILAEAVAGMHEDTCDPGNVDAR